MECKLRELLEKLDKNKYGEVKATEKNVEIIMNYIIENEISDISHFVNKDLKLNVSGYNSAVDRIKTKNAKFYNYYCEMVNNYKEETLNNINIALLYVGTLLNYGVELDDGSFRDFDIFDWFVIKKKYFANFNRPKFSKILDEFSKDPIIEQANIKYYNMRSIISRAFGDSLNKYNYKISKEFIFEDKKNGLTKDEVVWLINYMEYYNIPFNYNNYEVGVNKMIAQRSNANNLFEIDFFINEDSKKYIKLKNKKG